MSANEFITRFAPSPTGHLHLGHAKSAFHVWDAAQANNGKVLLRMEDIDQTRCKPEYEASILNDLCWLGLEWAGQVRRQSASEEKTRLSQGHPYAWRLSLEAAKAELGTVYDRLCYTELTQEGLKIVPADPSPYGDVVLARKETPTSYHLACCHDDNLQGVTHIIRGEDIRDMTSVHALLQALMGWTRPVYHFHPLIMGPDKRKLSKRAGDKGLLAWREDGMRPEDIRAMTGPS